MTQDNEKNVKCKETKYYAKKLKSWIIKNRQILSLGIVFFVYIWITHFYKVNYFPGLTNDNNATIPTFIETIHSPEFYYSFLASSYEDIVFFSLIGIAAFLFSLKRPEDEKLENRMNALFTNHHSVNHEVVNKAKKELKKLAVYSPETYLNITILDKIDYLEKTLLKIGIDREVHLKSMIHDLDNFDTEGKVEFYGETACALPKNIYGEINTIELMYDVDNIQKIVTNKQMTESVFTEYFHETFKKESKLVLHSNLWMWMIEGDVYEHTSYRTTANTSISVKNNIQEDIIVSVKGEDVTTLKIDEKYILTEEMFLEHGEYYTFSMKLS